MNSELEARLAEALAQRADQVRPSPPPAFSWQRAPAGAIGTGPARAHRGPRSHRRFPKLALTAVAAATLVVLAGFLVNTGRDTAPATGPGTREVAYLTPGFGTPMKAGQFFYRRLTTATPHGGSWTIEIWEPQEPTDLWTRKITERSADGSVIHSLGTGTATARCGKFDPEDPPGAITAGPHRQPSRPPSPPVRTYSTHQAGPDEGVGCTLTGSWITPTTAFINQAPREPAALYQQMRSYAETNFGTLTVTNAARDVYNVSFVLVNMIQSAALDVGPSRVFSQALEGATAQVPGIVIKHNSKNLSGTVGTSYEMDAPAGNVAGPLIFDANGNYIGRPDSAVSVGAADAAGAPPVLVTY